MSAPSGLNHYRLLGRSGLRVSPLCLGSMMFGGPGCDEAAARRQIDFYADAGGNFIDTAIGYASGASEQIIGRALAGRRDRFVVATKFGFIGGTGRPELGGNSRKAMVKALELSLERLATDHVDLLFLHVWEGRTPIEEVLRALDDVVRAGKVRYGAIDQTPAWKISQANTQARLEGLTGFIAYEGPYNLTERSAERELLPMARDHGLTFMAHSPLANGLLTGKYAGADSAPEGVMRTAMLNQAGAFSPRNLAIAQAVREVAAECARPASQVALAWLLSRPHRPLPVLGARTAEQLQENLGCLDLVLSEGQKARLDQVSAIDLGHPHSMLALPFVQQGMVGAGGSVEPRGG